MAHKKSSRIPPIPNLFSETVHEKWADEVEAELAKEPPAAVIAPNDDQAVAPPTTTAEEATMEGGDNAEAAELNASVAADNDHKELSKVTEFFKKYYGVEGDDDDDDEYELIPRRLTSKQNVLTKAMKEARKKLGDQEHNMQDAQLDAQELLRDRKGDGAEQTTVMRPQSESHARAGGAIRGGGSFNDQSGGYQPSGHASHYYGGYQGNYHGGSSFNNQSGSYQLSGYVYGPPSFGVSYGPRDGGQAGNQSEREAELAVVAARRQLLDAEFNLLMVRNGQGSQSSQGGQGGQGKKRKRKRNKGNKPYSGWEPMKKPKKDDKDRGGDGDLSGAGSPSEFKEVNPNWR
ncbi:hypothetical protein F5Y16DRAFT_398169 [Xylariaceae sp. FL0255]|nr:hypothetical protein F5Y16DRAFT_398169 [Xylariaceae sp. FL0255]